MHPTHHFIYNPRSREGAHARAVDALIAASPAGHCWHHTTAPHHATELTRQAALDGGAKVIVAVGGDGTVHEVVRGLMSIPPGERPVLGILPTGTGNDLAFAAGIPTDLQLAYQHLLRGNTTAIDVASIADEHGRESYFCNTAGFGFDARVVVRSKQLRAIKGNVLYLLSTLLTIAFEHEMMELEIRFETPDGASSSFATRSLMATIGNGPREGGGFLTTPHSRINDGGLELMTVSELSRPRMLSLLPRVMSGTHVSHPAVRLASFTSLSITSKTPLIVHTDGEIFSAREDGVRAVSVRIHQGAVRVISERV